MGPGKSYFKSSILDFNQFVGTLLKYFGSLSLWHQHDSQTAMPVMRGYTITSTQREWMALRYQINHLICVLSVEKEVVKAWKEELPGKRKTCTLSHKVYNFSNNVNCRSDTHNSN